MNFGYTRRMGSRLRRWLFLARHLRARLRFRAGRASFVECLIARTDSELTPIHDAAGRRLASRFLSRHALSCRPPRSGEPGWLLYKERVGSPGGGRFAALECAHCRHWYVIQVQTLEPALAAPDGSALAPSAEFRADWFRFPPSAFGGPARLNCPHCETTGEPRLEHLREP